MLPASQQNNMNIRITNIDYSSISSACNQQYIRRNSNQSLGNNPNTLITDRSRSENGQVR